MAAQNPCNLSGILRHSRSFAGGTGDPTDGADGLLDEPCEPALRGDQLILSNFDMPFPGLKNAKFDKPYTLCVIDVSKLERPR